jgi:hypothetical protein
MVRPGVRDAPARLVGGMVAGAISQGVLPALPRPRWNEAGPELDGLAHGPGARRIAPRRAVGAGPRDEVAGGVPPPRPQRRNDGKLLPVRFEDERARGEGLAADADAREGVGVERRGEPPVDPDPAKLPRAHHRHTVRPRHACRALGREPAQGSAEARPRAQISRPVTECPLPLLLNDPYRLWPRAGSGNRPLDGERRAISTLGPRARRSTPRTRSQPPGRIEGSVARPFAAGGGAPAATRPARPPGGRAL